MMILPSMEPFRKPKVTLHGYNDRLLKKNVLKNIWF